MPRHRLVLQWRRALGASTSRRARMLPACQKRGSCVWVRMYSTRSTPAGGELRLERRQLRLRKNRAWPRTLRSTLPRRATSRSEGLGAKGPVDSGCLRGYHNNLEVVRLDAFRRSAVFASGRGRWTRRGHLEAPVKRRHLRRSPQPDERRRAARADRRRCALLPPCLACGRHLLDARHQRPAAAPQPQLLQGRVFEPIANGVERFFAGTPPESDTADLQGLGFQNATEQTCLCKAAKHHGARSPMG